MGKLILRSFLSDNNVSKMKLGGRLFYIGAGTSGRIGILDASECRPTFGVPDNWIISIIAGGDTAIRKAVENAEDDIDQAWRDLSAYDISNLDVVIGIAASGNTPYVIGGLKKARENNIVTGSISCNSQSLISKEADFPIEIIVGPEFLTGSTRMKAGTSKKLVLNMISTSVMIKRGRIYGNKMIDMQLSNKKLVQRGVEMIAEELKIEEKLASELLKKYKSVRAILLAENKNLEINFTSLKSSGFLFKKKEICPKKILSFNEKLLCKNHVLCSAFIFGCQLCEF